MDIELTMNTLIYKILGSIEPPKNFSLPSTYLEKTNKTPDTLGL